LIFWLRAALFFPTFAFLLTAPGWGGIIKVAEPESKIVASRYARALFELAWENKLTDAVEKDLRQMVEALEASREFVSFIHNPLVNRASKAGAIDAIMVKLNANELTRRFMQLLAHNRRLDMLPQVVAVFFDMLAQQRGEIQAEVISASALSAAQLNTLRAALSTALNSKVNLKASQQESLLGGVVIKVGDMMLDSSIAGKMNRLQAAMRQHI
jgi:F-type H+-transporting ATPase subunit delta